MKTAKSQEYDYIIAGGGCAGLSLAINLSRSKLPFKKVLIVDALPKTGNDRTWCYWSAEPDTWYNQLAQCTWNQLEFFSNEVALKSSIAPYDYHMIRSADFYDYCKTELRKDERFSWLLAEIVEFKSELASACLITDQGSFYANRIFNSVVRTPTVKDHHINLIQHFKGWIIRSTEPVFDTECPIVMDFRVPQYNDCRFVYVLPRTKTEALVEYTGFSPSALEDYEYNEELQNYIARFLHIKEYTVLEKEQGAIPMYESSFDNPFGKRVTNIGTAGGASKTSTGYTFYFIQRQVERIVKDLLAGKVLPEKYPREKRFLLYDRILLQVIASKSLPAATIFSTLFERNSMSGILEFLNENSSLQKELKMFWTLPSLPFMKAAGQKL